MLIAGTLLAAASMTDSHEPLPAETVLDGKWRIEVPLGEGGMGIVYAATHVRNGLSVAIKVLHPKLASDPAVRQRFLDEGYAANRVGHPGTVQVLDDGQASDSLVYLVMERLVGEVVADRADRLGGALPLAEVVAIAEASLETLAAAHAAGIVHRDFKPENLFLTRDGALKVLDFGLARVKETSRKARLTVAGVLMGTPAFMPPEQAQANWDEVDARSDVYSIGASLFALATGQLVHDGATPLQILVKVSTEAAPPLLSLVPGAPPAIAAVVDRALQKPRDARWADAGAMLEALRAALGQAGLRPASLRAMATAAPISTMAEVARESTRTTEAGAPLEFDKPAPDAITADPATPRLVREQPPPSLARSRAVVVDPVDRGGGAAVDARAFAPTALPPGLALAPTRPSSPPPSAQAPPPQAPSLARGESELHGAAVRTVSPISSDAPTGRRRKPRARGQLATIVSGALLAAVVVAFVFALIAFRNSFRKKVVASEPPADERAPVSAAAEAPSAAARPPAPTAPSASARAPNASAAPSAAASSSAHHPPALRLPKKK